MATKRSAEEMKHIRDTARRQYADGSDDTIEVDYNAEMHDTGDKTGLWVQAWVYLSHSELEADGGQDEAGDDSKVDESGDVQAFEMEYTAKCTTRQRIRINAASLKEAIERIEAYEFDNADAEETDQHEWVVSSITGAPAPTDDAIEDCQS